MIIPISYFDINGNKNKNLYQQVQTLFENGDTSITVQELEKSYDSSPESRLQLMHDVTWYYENIAPQKTTKTTKEEIVDLSPRSWLTTLLLCIFLGGFGAHRFYTGRIATGLAQLVTLGGLGIWTFVDFFIICFKKFRDIDDRVVAK
jgi:TM2 domain-containing membrane protein YozV